VNLSHADRRPGRNILTEVVDSGGPLYFGRERALSGVILRAPEVEIFREFKIVSDRRSWNLAMSCDFWRTEIASQRSQVSPLSQTSASNCKRASNSSVNTFFREFATGKMRVVILGMLFAIAVVAIPLKMEMDIESNIKHLEKRSVTDSPIADAVKAIIAFGAFIWGGGIISRRAVDYYFKKKAEADEEKAKQTMTVMAKVNPSPTTVIVEKGGESGTESGTESGMTDVD
jgi:hypothetical protein